MHLVQFLLPGQPEVRYSPRKLEGKVDTSTLVGIGVCVLIAAVFLWSIGAHYEEKDKTKKKTIEALKESGADKTLVVDPLYMSVGIDTSSNSFFVFHNNISTLKRFDGSELISVELCEDGGSVTKTSSSRSLAGAIVGGVIAGPVGAIIGGLGGKSTGETSPSVSRLEIRLTINSSEIPSYSIPIIDASCSGVKRDSGIYREERKNAEHWLGLFRALIERADSSTSVDQILSQ